MYHLQPAVSRARWLAPEQITSASVAAPTEKTDIWSFGLLCLEVFTGKDPYHGHSDFYVPVLLSQGTHPEHPGSTAVGLSPKMWDLMQSCWQIDPGQRPSMSEIQSTIRDILPRRDGESFFLSHRRVLTLTVYHLPEILTSPSRLCLHRQSTLHPQMNLKRCARLLRCRHHCHHWG
jgi:serine/threonine protein kinase